MTPEIQGERSRAVRVAVVTISDTVSQGKREDLSGPGVAARCRELGWQVSATSVLPDERTQIEARLKEYADSGLADVIVTTGGTGVGPRDVTPEALTAVAEKIIPGLGEQMRAANGRENPRAALSRGVAGTRGRVLLLCLPGSPRGAVESLNAVAELLPHAVEVLRGAGHE